LVAVSAAVAQQSKVSHVGFLSPRSRASYTQEAWHNAFIRDMRDRGYVEGRNIQYEWRFAENDYQQLPQLAEELVKLKVDVIVAATTPSVRAAQQSTKTIPIVMASVGDPIATGLVGSLARPEGNTTGVANVFGETSKKQLDLLVAIVPKVSRVAVLSNPENPTSAPIYKSIQVAASHIGVATFDVHVAHPTNLANAFSFMTREHAQAFLVIADSNLIQARSDIVRLAAASKLPAVYPAREFADVGGLMSYGADLAEVYRRAAGFVDRILKGARPSELPVQQADKFEIVLNLRTAKALGIDISRDFRTRVDEVIE
jgi:putative tryptophan/tyrosine transport system substrate-binding protein